MLSVKNFCRDISFFYNITEAIMAQQTFTKLTQFKCCNGLFNFLIFITIIETYLLLTKA